MHTSTKHLKALIQERIEHSFINKFIQQPEIDEHKLSLLSLIMDNSKLPTHIKNRYVLTTMLVQIALDTHDLVPNTDDKSSTNLTTKQLTVLAGDYFSGLYYLLLAEIEDYEMIHMLASTIKEINEYKMKLHFNDAKTLEDQIHIIKKIDSLLIIRVAEYMNSPISNELIGDLLITSKLLDEKRYLYNQDYTSTLTKWLDHSNQTISEAIQVIESIIHQNSDRIESFISNENNFKVKESVQYVVEKVIFSNTSVAEEG